MEKEMLTEERAKALGIPVEDKRISRQKRAMSNDPGDVEEQQYKEDMSKFITKEEVGVLNSNIHHLEKCLKDKDHRLKAVEHRWKSFIWSWLLSGVVASFVLLFFSIALVIVRLPATIIFNPPETDTAWMVTDWWLLCSEVAVSVFAVVGLIAVILFLYMVFHKTDE